MPVDRALDPITFEVMRSAFEYTCERMSKVLMRSSFSPIIYDIADFSNALFSRDGELVGQAANCPVHLGAMHMSTRESIARFGLDDIHEGDVIALNDPYQGGTHTNDVTLTAPIFVDGEIVAFAVSRAHWADIGGSWGATHIAAEGLRIPPVKLVKRGQLNEDVFAFMRNATRVPQFVEGDVQAQFGALRAAEAEVKRLVARYGVDAVTTAMDEVVAYTERMTRAAIERIPDGVYEAEDYADTDGISPDPVRVRCRLTVHGDEVHVDFAGTDPVALGMINSPLANTYSAVYYSLKFFLNPDAPANSGMYRPITIDVPEGTWLNPAWPAPTLACTTVSSTKVNAVVWQALAQAIPDQMIACGFGDANWIVAAVTDDDGFVHIVSELPAGGWGGTPYHDGMSVTMDPLGNCQSPPAESAEMLYPVQYERFDFRPDSGGPGKFRGGVGANLQIRFGGRAELSLETSRTREGAPGANGGGRSPAQRLFKVTGDGRTTSIGGIMDDGSWENCLVTGHVFQPGEAFKIQTTGGGGWGDPLDRDPGLVLEDVLDELVSVDGARRDYGVVLVQDGSRVDPAATDALRRELRAAR